MTEANIDQPKPEVDFTKAAQEIPVTMARAQWHKIVHTLAASDPLGVHTEPEQAIIIAAVNKPTSGENKP